MIQPWHVRVVQCVSRVSVKFNGELTGLIAARLVLLGVAHADSESDAAISPEKIAGLRMF